MADEEKKTGGGNGTTAGPVAEDAPAAGLPPEPPASVEEEPEEEERQKITLDRYLGSRRRTHTGWGQLAILLFMLLTLVILLMYKDRCGDSVSGFIFMGTRDSGTPAVKIKLSPGESKQAPPSSRPTPSE